MTFVEWEALSGLKKNPNHGTLSKCAEITSTELMLSLCLVATTQYKQQAVCFLDEVLLPGPVGFKQSLLWSITGTTHTSLPESHSNCSALPQARPLIDVVQADVLHSSVSARRSSTVSWWRANRLWFVSRDEIRREESMPFSPQTQSQVPPQMFPFVCLSSVAVEAAATAHLGGWRLHF